MGSLALVGCSGASDKTAPISSLLNSSVGSETAVDVSDISVEYRGNFILGPKINITGDVHYRGFYSDEIEDALVSTIENLADTSSKISKIDRGEIDIVGVSGGISISSSEAYYGEEDKKVKIKDVLSDLEVN